MRQTGAKDEALRDDRQDKVAKAKPEPKLKPKPKPKPAGSDTVLVN